MYWCDALSTGVYLNTVHYISLTTRVSLQAIVTGGNSGLGVHTVAALASAGARVIMTSRNVGAGEDVAARLRHSMPDMKVKCRSLLNLATRNDLPHTSYVGGRPDHHGQPQCRGGQ